MTVTEPTASRAELAAAMQELSEPIPALMRQVAGAPSMLAVGTWTVGELAAHLVSGVEIYPAILRGEGSPHAVLDEATQNGAIAGVGTQDLDELAERFRAAVPACLEALQAAPEAVEWHEGIVLPAETAGATLAGEFAVHGHDLARAAKQPWRIPAHHARTLFRGLAPLLPHYVDTAAASGVRADICIKLRGDERPPLTLRFDDGTLEVVGDEPARPDCTISADPETFALVSYGRLGPLRPALTGRMVAYGRKPWVAFKLTSLLRSP